jgi:hypothetical protein
MRDPLDQLQSIRTCRRWDGRCQRHAATIDVQAATITHAEASTVKDRSSHLQGGNGSGMSGDRVARAVLICTHNKYPAKN